MSARDLLVAKSQEISLTQRALCRSLSGESHDRCRWEGSREELFLSFSKACNLKGGSAYLSTH